MSFVDPLLSWLLVFNPFLSILFISIILGVITTVVYKFASNQNKIKELKEKQKSLQKKLKTIPKDQPEKLMEVNSQMMKISGPLMKESFKPTLWTLLPSLLILTWMAANLAFAGIAPNQYFTIAAEFNEGVTGEISLEVVPDGLEFINGEIQEIVDSKAVWELKSDKIKTYNLLFKFRETEVNKDIIISNKWEYEEPEIFIKEDGLKKIIIGNEKIKPFKGIPVLEGINWLWSYIILTMIFTTILRKLMKIY
jgi:uncharacterized membrane protein (DUF106 family)